MSPHSCNKVSVSAPSGNLFPYTPDHGLKDAGISSKNEARNKIPNRPNAGGAEKNVLEQTRPDSTCKVRDILALNFQLTLF